MRFMKGKAAERHPDLLISCTRVIEHNDTIISKVWVQ